MNINVNVLLSKDKKFKNMNKYFGYLYDIKNPDDLPNALIICTHYKRSKDIITLVDRFNRSNILCINNKIYSIRFNIFIDEVDANCGIVKKFLQKIYNYLKIINKIIFIIATPFTPLNI